VIRSLLELDTVLFFQVISILFLEGKQQDFLAAGRNHIGNGAEVVSHQILLLTIDKVCSNHALFQEIRMHFLFFVGNVVS